MATYTFIGKASSQSVNWDDPTVWAGGVVPSTPDADVVFPTITAGSEGEVYYSDVTIKQSESYAVRSVNISNNLLEPLGSLSVSGALTVNNGANLDSSGPLSAGSLQNAGNLQTFGTVSSTGAVTNSGTIYAFDSLTFGSFLNTGTLDANSAVTLNVTGGQGAGIGLSGTTLTGGTYVANGGGSLNFNVGGLLTTDAATLVLGSSTFYGMPSTGAVTSSDDGGVTFLPLQTTLQTIAPEGALDIFGQNFTVLHGLTVQGSIALSGSASVSAAPLTIEAGGKVGGSGQITGSVVNDGTITSAAGEPDISPQKSLLVVSGSVSGSGSFMIGPGDIGIYGGLATSQIPKVLAQATLELSGATVQTISFADSTGILQLDDPQTFSGIISPAASSYYNQYGTRLINVSNDEVFLPGISYASVTGYSYTGDTSGGTLTIQEGSASQTLKFGGELSMSSFTLSAGPQAISTSRPSLEIQVSPVAAVTSDTATPATGDFGTGQTLTFTLATSEPVNVTGTPVLTLNDGGSASYSSGSGSSSLVFTTTVQPGQNAAALAVTGVSLPNGATVQDPQGNAADLSGAATTFASLSVDTTAPTAPSASLLVAPGEGATSIGLAAPSDDGTLAAQLAITVTALPTDGTVTLADGTTPVSAGEALTAAQLAGLEFTPGPGLSNASSALTYGVTDLAGNTAAGSATLTVSDVLGGMGNQVVLPAPVDGVATVDFGSRDLDAALGGGASLQVQPGTEAVRLTNGTLSVGPDTSEAFVQRLYEGLLGRGGDPGGLATYDGLLGGGASQADVATDILGSPEYAALRGSVAGMDDTGFVTGLYAGFLGRAPDQGGLAQWTGALAQGVSPGQVAADFAQSPEAVADLAGDTARVWVPSTDGALVTQLYLTGLGRNPDLGGLQNWTGALQAGLTPAQLADAIAASPEFGAAHAGQDAGALVGGFYADGLGRTLDAAGAQFWGGALQAGADPGSVLLAIATSPEAGAHLSPAA